MQEKAILLRKPSGVNEKRHVVNGGNAAPGERRQEVLGVQDLRAQLSRRKRQVKQTEESARGTASYNAAKSIGEGEWSVIGRDDKEFGIGL